MTKENPTPEEVKLNAEYDVKLQGGALIILIKILANRVGGMMVAESLGKSIGMKLPANFKEEIAMLDSIGSAITDAAEKIFGKEYIKEILTSDPEAEAEEEEDEDEEDVDSPKPNAPAPKTVN